MSDDNVRNFGLSSRAKPSRSVDGVYNQQRTTRYGEQVAVSLTGNRLHGLADEGSYFFAQQPIIDASTTLAGHAAPVLADLYTKPFLHIINTDTVAGDTRVFLDFIEIQLITAGANGTSDNWAAECDTGATRYSSGTVATLTTVNPNMQSTATPKAVSKAGPFVASAATTSQRRMGSGVFRPSIGITGDKYLWVFGGQADTQGAAVAAAASRFVIPMPPVILGPTDQFLLHLYAPSQSAAAVYKINLGFWER
jgi:hypothetical protein